MKRRNHIQRYYLTLWLGLVVVFYHAVNVTHWLFVPSATTQTYRILGFEITLPLAASHASRSFDFSTAYLRDLGFVARYALGQGHPLISIKQTSPIDLYERRDLEIFYPEYGVKESEQLIPRLAQYIGTLEAHGVRTLILPIPPKTAIERERIPASLPPLDLYSVAAYVQKNVSHDVAEQNYHALVQAFPRNTIDLFQVYRAQRAVDERLFVPWDYHWTALGMALATEASLDKLRADGWRIGDTRLVRDGTAPPNFNFRLLNLLQLPSWYLAENPALTWREGLYRVDGRTSGSGGRVILLAESNGDRWAGTPYNIGRQIANVLNRDLHNFTVPGGGATATTRRLAESSLELSQGDLLVWAFQVPASIPPGTELLTPRFAPLVTRSLSSTP